MYADGNNLQIAKLINSASNVSSPALVAPE
jgi:hypothetical protein